MSSVSTINQPLGVVINKSNGNGRLIFKLAPLLPQEEMIDLKYVITKAIRARK